jgi:hypothetical protein
MKITQNYWSSFKKIARWALSLSFLHSVCVIRHQAFAFAVGSSPDSHSKLLTHAIAEPTAQHFAGHLRSMPSNGVAISNLIPVFCPDSHVLPAVR